MNIINPFHLHVNKTSKLKLLSQFMTSGEYGGTYFHFRKVESIKHFVKKKLLGRRHYSHRLRVISSIDGVFIPMADVDSSTDMLRSLMWLDENKEKYVVVESSPDHFWIFLNQTHKKGRKAVQAADMVPRVDGKYLKCSIEVGAPVVRAELYKDSKFVPCIKTNTADNASVVKFTAKLIEHFNTDEVEWIRRWREYSDGKTDLSNPMCGTPLNVSLADFI